MTHDVYTVSPEQIQASRAKMEHWEGVWKQHRFANVDNELLAAQQKKVEAHASQLKGREHDLAVLMDKARTRLREARQLTLSLKLSEFWQLSSAPIHIGVAGALLSGFLGTICGLLVKPSLGILVAFIVIALTTIVVVLVHYCRDLPAARLRTAGIKANLGNATQQLGFIESEVTSGKKVVDQCLAQSRTEQECYSRMSDLYRIRQNYENARTQYDRLLQLVQSVKYQLLHSEWRALRGTDLSR